MCKLTNKTLFAAGIGLQLLVYYCATSFPIMNVVNPKGNKLEDIYAIGPEVLENLRR